MMLRGTAALVLFCSVPLAAQQVDSSANGTVSGDYFVRELVLTGVLQTGAIGRARAITGVITFDGAGNYTLAGQLADTDAGGAGPLPFQAAGTYSVASSGMFEMQNPLDPKQNVYGAVGTEAIVGSSTEADFHEVFVAVPAGADGADNSALSGRYYLGSLDYMNGKGELGHSGMVALDPDGKGTLADGIVYGNGMNLGNTSINQYFRGATYSISGRGAGTLTVPVTEDGADQQLLSGQKVLYVSANRNVLLGGAANGFDIVVGVRANSTPASNSIYQGLYYIAGITDDGGDPAFRHIYCFSGSTTANGSWLTVSHRRVIAPYGGSYDLTSRSGFSFDQNGLMLDPNDRSVIGAGGDTVLTTGSGTQYGLVLQVKARPVVTNGMFLSPVGIVNAASYAPITNRVAPGEMVAMYGSELADGPVSAMPPYQTTLGGVQVTVNGRPATLQFVSPGQITAIVPYGTVEKYATFQVIRNGQASNAVTLYTNVTAPGVFTVDSSGIGPGSVMHVDGSPVTSANPAHPGETIVFFATGLGDVVPRPADGAPGSANARSLLVNNELELYIDLKGSKVSYAGLAPGYAGVYLIVCQIPPNASTGDVPLDIDAVPGGYTSLATVAVAP